MSAPNCRYQHYVRLDLLFQINENGNVHSAEMVLPVNEPHQACSWIQLPGSHRRKLHHLHNLLRGVAE